VSEGIFSASCYSHDKHCCQAKVLLNGNVFFNNALKLLCQLLINTENDVDTGEKCARPSAQP